MNGYLLGRSVPNTPPYAFWSYTNFGMGSWQFRDLDNAASLAYVLNEKGKTSASELCGDGTLCPIGLDLGLMTRLFYRVKTLDVTGTISGAVDSVSTLKILDPAADVTVREELIAWQRIGFVTPFVSGSYEFEVVIGSNVDGYKFDGKAYPVLLGLFTPGFGGSTTNKEAASGSDIVGELHFYDETVNLYGTTGFSEGDIDVTEGTLWT